MPDWIVHISIALLLAVILKIKNWKLMITGAVLPDIPRILLIISNYLNFNELNSFLILEPLHSPFLNIFESMAIALLFANFFQNFLLVYLGVITHYVLDYFQFAGKFGHLLLYPFSYEQFSLNLFYGGSLILLVLGLIVTIMSLYLLKEKNNLILNKKFYYAIIPIIITLFFVFLTPSKLLENNVSGSDFVLNPEKYENREVSLYHSKVVSLNSAKIEEMGNIFDLEIKEKLELNSFVTISGIYKDKKIQVQEIFHNNLNKIYFSLIGLLLYIYLILKKD
ncbi:metal-dependent hydrolase [Candidatus Woesearchaeota archaeon]|nr:metal-dependent hydrolase [Candidatus Woesearchaeota archaeon]